LKDKPNNPDLMSQMKVLQDRCYHLYNYQS